MKISHLLLINILLGSATLNASVPSFLTSLQELAAQPQVKQILGDALICSGVCSAALALSNLSSIKDDAVSSTVKSVFTSMPRFLAMGLATAMLRYGLTEITDSRIVWFCVTWFAFNALGNAINIEFTKTSSPVIPEDSTAPCPPYKHKSNPVAREVTVLFPAEEEMLYQQDSNPLN